MKKSILLSVMTCGIFFWSVESSCLGGNVYRCSFKGHYYKILNNSFYSCIDIKGAKDCKILTKKLELNFFERQKRPKTSIDQRSADTDVFISRFSTADSLSTKKQMKCKENKLNERDVRRKLIKLFPEPDETTHQRKNEAQREKENAEKFFREVNFLLQRLKKLENLAIGTKDEGKIKRFVEEEKRNLIISRVAYKNIYNQKKCKNLMVYLQTTSSDIDKKQKNIESIREGFCKNKVKYKNKKQRDQNNNIGNNNIVTVEKKNYTFQGKYPFVYQRKKTDDKFSFVTAKFFGSGKKVSTNSLSALSSCVCSTREKNKTNHFFRGCLFVKGEESAKRPFKGIMEKSPKLETIEEKRVSFRIDNDFGKKNASLLDGKKYRNAAFGSNKSEIRNLIEIFYILKERVAVVKGIEILQGFFDKKEKQKSICNGMKILQRFFDNKDEKI